MKGVIVASPVTSAILHDQSKPDSERAIAAIKFRELDLDETAKSNMTPGEGKVVNEKGLSEVARLMVQLLKETGYSVDNLENQVYAQGRAGALSAIAQEFAHRLTAEPLANDERSRTRLEAALAESPGARELWNAELAKLELRPGKRSVMQAMINALSHADPAASSRYSGSNELVLQQVIDDYAKAEKAGKLSDTQEVERLIVGKLVVESQLAVARRLVKQ